MISDDRSRNGLEIGCGVCHSIFFVGDLKHGKIVHGISETDEFFTMKNVHEFFRRRRLGNALRHDLQPRRIGVDIARKNTTELVLQLFIDGYKRRLRIADTGKIIDVPVQRLIERENLPSAAIVLIPDTGEYKLPLRLAALGAKIGKPVCTVNDCIGERKQPAPQERGIDDLLFFGRKFCRPNRAAADAVDNKRAVMHDDGNINFHPLRDACCRVDTARRRIGKMHARTDKASDDRTGICAQGLIGAQKRSVQIAQIQRFFHMILFHEPSFCLRQRISLTARLFISFRAKT